MPFEPAKNEMPLLFPTAVPGPQTYIEPLVLNAVVDLVFINPSLMVHPMHLHGTQFWVLGSGNGPIFDSKGNLDYSMLNLRNPPKRDTQAVPQAIFMSSDSSSAGPSPAMEDSNSEALSYGWAVVRVVANNPGVWPMHCHIDLHANSGRFMAFDVRPKLVKVKGTARAPYPWALPKGVTQCGL